MFDFLCSVRFIDEFHISFFLKQKINFFLALCLLIISFPLALFIYQALEEHHLYKLQYLHFGAPRIWYGTPGSESLNFEAIAKKHLPWSDNEHADLLLTPVSLHFDRMTCIR